MELEIDDHERRTIKRSLVARRSRLIEKTEDTTLTTARRQAGFRELLVIGSVLRKLRLRTDQETSTAQRASKREE